eukprot:CAMPEP_0172521570 /NCGR_PEP_ID=MMETSP1066-20121228/292654_1 /TAXON_ID=671091 /ORGANISM="Coscinodiscus wailesii, Strain CCMP2513" /LENGTH=260 /DNA_ID=CAMNT_0013304497 /DNA_START=259 /DNA_END=1041 /DNA_ORIENTATION=-
MTATTALSSILITNTPLPASAAAAIQDNVDVNEFLRTGVDIGGNMGVSSQAGKSRPETGVVLRDGSDLSRDGRTGAVVAEIVVRDERTGDNTAVLASFASPWPLATGPVFDVECRDGKTGDGVFLAVSRSGGGKGIEDVEEAVLLQRLFDPTGRFSFYGPPTDIKVKKSVVKDKVRYLELKFSNLSQSTGAEIPRNAIIAATIPESTQNVVMLVGSASSSRWRKGSEDSVRAAVESFQAVPAPKSSMKIRAKPRGGDLAL